MAVPQLFDLIGLEPCSQVNLAKMIDSGLPLGVISALKEAGLTATEISEIITSPRTLKSRKTRNEPLSLKESDRVVRLARIISQADGVFASRDKALLWLRTPDDRLDGCPPLKWLVSGAGARVVESLLQQVDDGIYA
jgi:putative toxin-antitoxin system antitoxin component (TIGR02293 family)